MKGNEAEILLRDMQEYRELTDRVKAIYGDQMTLKDMVDVMERIIREPGRKDPVNARILTYDEASMWDEYRKIGTVEECREWKEKQSAKKVISFDYNNGTVNYGCPVCKRKIISKIDGKWCGGTFNEYCDRCGQKLDWSDEE